MWEYKQKSAIKYVLPETPENKEIEKLKLEIEEMKCCENCRNAFIAGDHEICCQRLADEKECCISKNFKHWEKRLNLKLEEPSMQHQSKYLN